MLSALGALTGGSRREKSRTVLLDAGDRAALEREWRRLERTVLAEFAPAERPRVRRERWAEVRYRGQSHELSLPASGAAGVAGLAERFHLEHLRRFGFASRELPVQVVTLEARGWLAGERVPRGRGPGLRPQPASLTRVRHAGAWRTAKLWAGESLAPGFTTLGPAIVADSGATLWIAPGWRAHMDTNGTLVLTRGRG